MLHKIKHHIKKFLLIKPEEEEKTISFLLLFIIVMVGLEMGSGISASLNTNIFQIICI